MRICPQCRERMEQRVCPKDGFQTVDEAVVKGAKDPRVGKVFEARYRIDDVLGRGGMGTVYRATQLAVGRPVAIKVLNADRVGDLTTIARFQQEARSVATLRHPNTIRLIDFGHAEDGTLFLVMEYLEGEPLSHLIKREAPLSADRVIRIAQQVLESLAEAHNIGIIHRDLKPDNLFVTELFGREDFVKILDFGIAKVTGFGPDPTLTGAGIALGSPRYMSPEQASAGTVDARTDIYALAVVLYEMLTGAPPFVYQSVAQYMMAHVEEAPPPLQIQGRVVGGLLPEIILGCLSKHASARPESALALLEALEECKADPFAASSIATATVSLPPAGGQDHRALPDAPALEEAPAAPPRTLVEEPAAPRLAAPITEWPAAPVHTGPPVASPRASDTGLAPRGYHAVPPPPPSTSTPNAAPLLLVAILLLGLGGSAAWWMLGGDAPEPAVEASSVASVTEVAPMEPAAAPVASPDEVGSDEPTQEPEEAAPPSSDGVVMLVTVPAGATVKRGSVILGTTPFALVWGGGEDGRALRVELEGYEPEKLKHADVGSAAHYELYLRPKGASKARRPAKRRPAKGADSWVSKISKPAKRKTTSRAAGDKGAEPAKAPAQKSPVVYEELD